MEKKSRTGALRAAMMVVLVAASGFLGGCVPSEGLDPLTAIVSAASVAMPVGAMVDKETTNAATDSIRVQRTDVRQLCNRLSPAAQKLGYRIDRVDAQGVRIVRQNENYATAIIGRRWQETITVNVVDGGNALQILAQTGGNGGHAAPGTAQKIIDELEPYLIAAYAAR